MESQVLYSSELKNKSTISCVLLNIIPFLTIIIDLYVVGTNFSNFSRNASICSMIPLFIPFILRNYTDVKAAFDYKMCTISNFMLISKFIITCFTDDSHKKLFNQIIKSSENNIFVPYIVSLSADIILATFYDKTLAICYKVMTTIGLMIFIIGNRDLSKKNIIIENSFMSFLIFTIPAFLILRIGNKRRKLCTVLSMVTFYSNVVNFYIWAMMLTPSSSKTGIFDSLGSISKYIPGFI